MTYEIFISYSRKDSDHALLLAEELRKQGMSVWIDQKGIEGGSDWAASIVEAIRGCKAFLVLLSDSSVISNNVLKELSLANEKQKRIIPIDIDQMFELPPGFEYPLAGLQRIRIGDREKVIRAIEEGAPRVQTRSDERKTLMVLPFEDLSPARDNGWFTDGLVSELIAALSNVRSLKLIDWHTTKEFKERKVSTALLANELGVTYFLEGSVRMFQDQVKVTVQLLDYARQEHIWTESHKGIFSDIFEIQESVAEKVVRGLKLHLTYDEGKQLSKRSTNNAAAYELFLRGKSAYTRNTRKDYEQALELYTQAFALDPNYVDAIAGVANMELTIYRFYSGEPQRLERAEAAIEKVRELAGESPMWHNLKSRLALRRGDVQMALEHAQESVRIDRDFSMGYEAWNLALQSRGEFSAAARVLKEALRLRENDPTAHFNLIAAHFMAQEVEEVSTAVEVAMPLFERHLRLNPDDYATAAMYANILRFGQYYERARKEAERLIESDKLDHLSLYNLSSLFLEIERPDQAMDALQRSVAKGMGSVDLFRRDPGLDALRGRSDFQALMQLLEERSKADPTIAKVSI